MNRSTKLLTGLATASVVSAGVGIAAMPAHADMRVLTVTLLGGAKVTVTMDVPPGTPLDQLTIPGVSLPVVDVQDSGPAAAPSTSSATQTQTSTSTPSTPPPAASSTSSTSAQASTETQTSSSQPASTQTQSSEAPAGTGSTAASAPTAPASGATSSAAAAPTPATPATTGTTGTTGTTATKPGKPGAKPSARPEATAQREQAASASKKPKAQRDAEAEDAEAATKAAEDGDGAGRLQDGVPTPASPGYSLALPGAAAVGVPNFFIDKFRIPPFLLPIYQAAGIQYGVRWEVLAAINEIETDYGRNLNVSSAGALGWMQFMPATWQQYGTDANDDGKRDPYNPVDAIFASARYLKAAGGDTDIRKAVFAYNHADWYVNSVLMRAQLIAGMPADLVGSLSGLTEGHFPVHATARYADAVDVKTASKRVKSGNAADPVEGDSDRKGVDIYAKAGSPAIAVQDGRVVKIGTSARLGKFVMLRDVYGNTYTYGHLKTVSNAYPTPKEAPAATDLEALRATELTRKDPKPTQAASAGSQATEARTSKVGRTRKAQTPAPATSSTTAGGLGRTKLFAMPSRVAAKAAGGDQQLLDADTTESTFKAYFTDVYGLKRSDVRLKPMKVGAKVIAGTVLGRLGVTQPSEAPHLRFEIRPAGEGAPRIDPKPILDGWKLLESTAIYRAKGSNPFLGTGSNPSIGQTLLMSKEALTRQVLADPRVEVTGQGRTDIRTGSIDRRVLATLEFLSASGLRPTVTMLRTGHSTLTSSGNVSEHISGNAVDIGAINGIRIQPSTQGAGSITDVTIRRLLTLQGTMKPHQIISLMTFPGTDNTLSLPDHADHIHVGFKPLYAQGKKGRQLDSALKPGQWIKLISRLGAIENPEVLTSPSKYALTVKGKGAAGAVPDARGDD